MTTSTSPPPLSAVSPLSPATRVNSPEISTISPQPEPERSEPILALNRTLSISGLEVVFDPPTPASPTPNHDPSNAPEVVPSTDSDKIPLQNQDPQDPASAPEVVNPLQNSHGINNGLDADKRAQRGNTDGEPETNNETRMTIEPDLPPYSPARAPAEPRTESGQIRERGKETVEEWNNPLWGCFSRCDLLFESLFCPCILAGRTHGRITKPDQDYHPANNGYCVHCCVLILPMIVGLPLWCLPMSANRRELRFRYGLKGSNYGDICASLLCPCCVLVQEEREVVGRRGKKGKNNGNGGRQEGYRMTVEEMGYVDQTQTAG